jgi:hypothetical protein
METPGRPGAATSAHTHMNYYVIEVATENAPA